MEAHLIPQFDQIQHLILQAEQKATLQVNRELLGLYWEIGAYLHHQAQHAGWGKQVVQQLATYLQTQRPGRNGFSAQNLWRMKQLYEAYQADEKLSPLVREIPWTPNTSANSTSTSKPWTETSANPTKTPA